MAGKTQDTGAGSRNIIHSYNRKAGQTAKGTRRSTTTGKGRVIKLDDSSISSQIHGLTPDNVIFAMDIGTRTVVGVVGVQEDKCFRVLATEVCEHKNRAMIDGQVHDIEQASITALEVKEKLEARIGFQLKKVAIAAAGRVLKTCQVKVEKNLEPGTEIDEDFVSSLEIEGIQRAQMELDSNCGPEDKTQYYCVGYSVVNYYLNGYMISKLAGHRGKTAEADILATFLPLTVVDSLYSVVNRIGLEVSSLTLEPIAAINVAIPPDLRLLNLALVDIGAGTSDIALTRDGSVFAYAMVSTAGDEITEKISQQYLVDFNTGEKIKMFLSTGKDHFSFTDILKKKHTVTADEVMKVVDDSVRQLASTISRKILEFNHKAPNAVFLIGGGSRIPMLPGLIAEQLGLPQDRVAVRGRDVIRGIRYSDKKLYGPESITPYGIAVTAQMYAGKDFISVTVNNKKLKLLNAKKLTIADALILYGYSATDLIGRSGRSVTFTVNGDIRRVHGEYGVAAEIYLNGKQASLDTPLSFGDEITVVPAHDGKDAEVKAYELVSDYVSGAVYFNGNPVDISTKIMINGSRTGPDTIVKDGDAVEISAIRTLGDLLDAAGFSAEKCEIRINDQITYDLAYALKDNDQITCTVRENINQTDAAEPGEAVYTDIPVDTENDREDETEDKNFSGTYVHGETGNTANIIVNGKAVSIADNKSQHIFVDVFNYIDFDLSQPHGTIVLKLNGKPAAFTDIIRNGDVIDIYWDK